MRDAPDSGRPRYALAGGALALLVVGIYALAISVTNNPLEGWGMLLRALVGHALVLLGVGVGAHALRSASPARAVATAAMALALVLTPLSLLLLLVTRESGSSWSAATLILAAWFAAVGVVARVTVARRAR